MELAEVWRGKETLLTVRRHLGGASGGIRVITLEHGVIGLLFIAELVTSLEPHAAVWLKAADHANILTWLHQYSVEYMVGYMVKLKSTLSASGNSGLLRKGGLKSLEAVQAHVCSRSPPANMCVGRGGASLGLQCLPR